MGSEPIQILLVEDDEDHAELIRLGFEAQNPAVRLTIARSLAEARARMGEALPDAILLDSLLPDGRGLDLLPGGGARPPYAVVLLTSHGDGAMKSEALAAGVLEYVVKSEATLLDLPATAEGALRRWKTPATVTKTIEPEKDREPTAASRQKSRLGRIRS